MNLKPHKSRDASITPIPNGWRLTIPPGPANSYRLSQLDDYAHITRQNYPHFPSSSLELKARVSSSSVPGTLGFGLWNDPFGLSLGFGGNPFRLPILPNAVWFFHASEQNYLSFKDPSTAVGLDTIGKAPTYSTSGGSARPPAVNGFIAQIFRAPKFHPLLLAAGMAFPFSRKRTRKYLGRIIDEDAATVSVDVTEWHSYRLEWSPTRSAFWVDEALVLDSPVSPRPPLGLVIWIDNQYAAFSPNGRIAYGILEGKEEWLEIEDIIIRDA